MPRALGEADPAPAGTETVDASHPRRSGRRSLSRQALSLSSDRRLARRAAAGDPEAFAAIFRRYQQDLYCFCVGILREPQDAEDAVQNTMMRAMRALPGERREMELKPWLFRIAHNEAVELRRRERPVEPLPATIDHGAGTEERFERDASLRMLLADIADLPERQRSALVMRELNGLGFGEIGAVLGTSPAAVRQALYEARRGLSQMELGRDMDCEAAMLEVSDAEGRPRDRGVRAHLRDCARCRRFQAEIREREGTLASITPLPALAAAGLLQSVLGGSAAGGAGMAAGGAGVGGASTMVGAGVGVGAGGAGAVAGSVGLSGAVKAGVGVLAALAVGTAAVDHDALLRDGGNRSPGVERRQADGGPSASTDRDPTQRDVGIARASDDRAISPAGRTGLARGGRPRQASGGEPTNRVAAAERKVGSRSSTTPAAPAETESAPTGFTEPPRGSHGNSGAGHAPAAPETKAPSGGAAEPNAAEVVDQGEGAEQPEHAAQPEQPEHPEHPSHSDPPDTFENGAAAETKGGTTEASSTEAGEAKAHPEHPEHPGHPAHPEQSQKESAPAEETESVEGSSTAPALEADAVSTEAGEPSAE